MPEYVQFPVVDMREGPSEKSKVVSQALFGEKVAVGECSGGWVLIATPDGYSGWVQEKAILSRSEYPHEIEVARLSAHIFSIPDTEYGPMMTLPFGTKLHLLDGSDARWMKVELLDGREAFVQKGDVLAEPFELVSFSKKFLGLPYTWGGRSSFGYDCSGFVQMLYLRMGIFLPRDARQQILKGKEVEDLLLSDLIFWGFSAKEIKHVGMYLGNGQFIHTSVRENKPYLRISQLSDPEWNGSGYYPYRTARRFLWMV